MNSIREQILDELDHLTPDQQAHVLSLVRQLRQSSLQAGTPGDVLLAARDRFKFDPEDIAEMTKAIEEGCEHIDWDSWR